MFLQYFFYPTIEVVYSYIKKMKVIMIVGLT